MKETKGLTIEDFKKQYPQHKDLEGDELWNKMEDVLFETGEQFVPETYGKDKVYKYDGNVLTLKNPLTWKSLKDGRIISDEELNPSPVRRQIKSENYRMIIMNIGENEK